VNDNKVPDEDSIEPPKEYNGKEQEVDSHDPDASWGDDDD
jgi:hypothetical protein